MLNNFLNKGPSKGRNTQIIQKSRIKITKTKRNIDIKVSPTGWGPQKYMEKFQQSQQYQLSNVVRTISSSFLA